jgi:hypothetical protein
MALRSTHEDCIKRIVVHPTKSEGYTLWWNGGTIREMMRDEALYNRESVHLTLQAAILINSNDDYHKKFDTARRVEVFRKKRHESVWTFFNTTSTIATLCTMTCHPTTLCCIFRQTPLIRSTSAFAIGPWLGISMI